MMKNHLEVKNLVKKFDDNLVLKDISFEVDRESVFAVLGPSGCGKSTILNLIAGIEKPDRGKIMFAGQDFTHLPPHQRNFGLMFQEYALFPHMNVAENVTFGLKMQGMSREFINERLEEVLSVVDLDGYQKRDVISLSGGERQRVAFARTLAPNPELIMLDEPLGSLDRKLRDVLLERLRNILSKMEVPAIYVTHDPYEALIISDRIAIMKDGRFIEVSTPAQLFLNPKTSYTANFIGIENIFSAEIVKKNGETRLVTSFGEFAYPTDHRGPVEFIIKPGFFTTSPKSVKYFEIRGIVEDCMFTGHDYFVELKAGQKSLSAHLKPTDVDEIRNGDPLSIFFNPDSAIHIFEHNSE